MRAAATTALPPWRSLSLAVRPSSLGPAASAVIAPAPPPFPAPRAVEVEVCLRTAHTRRCAAAATAAAADVDHGCVAVGVVCWGVQQRRLAVKTLRHVAEDAHSRDGWVQQQSQCRRGCVKMEAGTPPLSRLSSARSGRGDSQQQEKTRQDKKVSAPADESPWRISVAGARRKDGIRRPHTSAAAPSWECVRVDT